MDALSYAIFIAGAVITLGEKYEIKIKQAKNKVWQVGLDWESKNKYKFLAESKSLGEACQKAGKYYFDQVDKENKKIKKSKKKMS